MVRLALRLEYDGAAYGGSQRQRTAPSVQAALEEAIERLTGERVRTAFAGRTDAGVHALGQVAAFESEAAHAPDVWQRALNAHLPEDIAVQAVAFVAAGFDPRRHALARTYRYRVWNTPVRAPVRRRDAWWVRGPLDARRMHEAATGLIGEHDFAAFGGSPGPGRSTWRRMMQAVVCQQGPLVTLELVGNAFLPHQVRRTAGALVEIGLGRLAVERFTGWLARPEPGAAGPAAPPHGLCLIRVEYPEPLFPDDRQEED